MPAAIWREATNEQSNGSYLQGEWEGSYARLLEVFGEPHNNGDGGYKVRVGWAFQVGKQIITIYDWKSDVPVEDEDDWHIGGFNFVVVELVNKKLKGTK